MKCINFDKEFERCLTEWMKKHSGEYKNYDEMEEKMPEIYEEFLSTPLSWLGGRCPGDYFEQFDNARMLVNHMEDYLKQRIPVPDMLMNRITALGSEAEQPLYDLLMKERASDEARMLAVSLLREAESELGLNVYLDRVAAMPSPVMDEEEDEDGCGHHHDAASELCENMLESLSSLGEKAVPGMRERLKQATEAGREAFCSLLCHYPDEDEQVFETLIALFEADRAQQAVLADYLGKLGNEKAVEPLKSRAASEETGYLDYIELRNAIEALGGECPIREFEDNDPQYEAMRTIEKRMTEKKA